MDLFASNFITNPYGSMSNQTGNTPSFVNPYKTPPSFASPAQRQTQRRAPVVRTPASRTITLRPSPTKTPKLTPSQQAKLDRKQQQSKPGTIDVQEEIVRQESTNSINWAKLYINNDRTPINISESAILPAADYNDLTIVEGGFIDRLLIAEGEGSNQKYYIFKTKDDARNFQSIIQNQVALNTKLFITTGYIKIIKNNGRTFYYVINMRKSDKPELYIKSYTHMSDAPPEIFNFYTPSPEEMLRINENERISSFVNNSNNYNNNLFLIFILIIILIIYVYLSRRNQKNNKFELSEELT